VKNFGKAKRNRVFTEEATATARDILKQNIQKGTGTAANIGCPAGGKTGTTDNFTDAWFVGFTPRMTTATWVGYPQSNRISMDSVRGIRVAGGTFPAEIWGDYMKVAKRKFCKDWPGGKGSGSSPLNGGAGQTGPGGNGVDNPGGTGNGNQPLGGGTGAQGAPGQ
ncbi:MAG: penicillin-binding transpeptidase domain-containing protein, partial [Solirubrobacteraceae bacterium]